ncbi:MAG: helix-turn-helix domain-containing protein [Flavobacterium sp.]
MLNTDDFKVRLEQIFSFYGLTPATFAEQIGVQRSSLSHLLSGRNKPSLDFILKVEECYSEVDFDWLLQGKGVFPKSKNQVSTSENASAPQRNPPIETTQLKTETPQLHSLFSEIEPQENEPKKITAVEFLEPPVVENKILNEKNFVEKNAKPNIPNKIREVIIFYEDGTFENYKPRN